MEKIKHIGLYPCPFGFFRIVEEEDAVVAIDVVKERQEEERPSEVTDWAARELHEYLEGERRAFTFPYRLVGTPFRLQVWKELEKVPDDDLQETGGGHRAAGGLPCCRRRRRSQSPGHCRSMPPCHWHERQSHRICLGAADEGGFIGAGAPLTLSERCLLQDARCDNRDRAGQHAFCDEARC